MTANNKWWVMTAVAIGVFLSTIDGSIVNVALPILARELGAPFAAVQWVVLAYLLTLVTLMMAVGRLADLHGKKQLYVLGFVIFTLGSLSCGLSPNVGFLVTSRVAQAVGASLLMALGAAIATEAFPAEERGRAMGTIGVMVSIGLISGPTVGGLLLGVFSWHAIFFVNLPLGVLGTTLALRVIPTRPPPPPEPFDLAGALLLFVALLSFLLGVTLGPQLGFTSLWVLLLGAASLLGFVLFVRTEMGKPSPLIDLSMFRSSRLSVHVVTGALTFVASSGLVLLLPFFLQDLQERPPAEAGLLLVVAPLTMGIAAPVAGYLSDRFGTTPLTASGLAVLVFGYSLVGTLELDTSSAGYVARVAWVGLGMGIFQSPNNSAIMGSVSRDRLGVASGLLSLTRTLGQTTGVALIGAVWAALVHLLARSPLGDATHAPHVVQLEAFGWVVRGIALVMALALGLVLMTWAKAPRAASR